MLTGVVDRYPVDDRVRPGKVDEFHRANCQLGVGGVVIDVEPVSVNDDQLAGFDVADELGPDDV